MMRIGEPSFRLSAIRASSEFTISVSPQDASVSVRETRILGIFASRLEPWS